jgi:PEP-CTERM motif-containing protein
MKHFTVGVALFFCLSSTNPANASAIYDFSLAANGAVSAFDIQLTFPDLLPAGGLLVIPVTAPVVTSLTFATPGFNPAGSVIGLQITPPATLFGLALFSATDPLLLTVNYPLDFFVFNRAPVTTGTFSSVSGNVVSVRSLTTETPVGTLSVTTSVPEPSTLLLLGSGVLCVSVLRRRVKSLTR